MVVIVGTGGGIFSDEGRGLLARLYSYYRENLPGLLLGVFGIILTSLATLSMGGALRELVSSDSSLDYLKENGLYLVAMALSLTIGSGIRGFMVNYCTEQAILRMATDVYSNVLQLSAGAFKSPEQVISRFSSDMTTAMSSLGNNASFTIRGIITLFGSIVLLVYSSWKMSLFTLLIVPVISLTILFFGRAVKRASKNSQSKIAELLEGISESIYGISVVQAFCQEKKAVSSFIRLREIVLRAAKRRLGIRSIFVVIMMSMVFAALAVLSIVGIYYTHSGHITTGELTAFIFYSFLSGVSLGGLAESASEAQHAFSACARLSGLLDLKPEITVAAPREFSGNDVSIVLQNINFSYPNAQRQALSCLSLEIEEGSSMSIVGMSGAGKSTICALLLRMYDINSGSITIGGVPIETIPLPTLRGIFGYVPSEPALFRGSLLENIVYGVDSYSMEDVHSAIAIAELSELVEMLGLDHEITTRSTLSSGQKQRVAVARAVMKKPRVLLFDEASSALDYNTDKLVRGNIDVGMPGITKIFVTHRLQTISSTDTVVVIDEGCVESVGSMDYLARNSMVFAKLMRTQSV